MSDQLLLDTDENGSFILPPKRTFLVTPMGFPERARQELILAHSISQTDGSLRFHELTVQHNHVGEETVMAWERRAFAAGQWAEFQEVFDVTALVH